MSLDAEAALDVVAFERVARPLRRLLARGASDRAAHDAMFALNCGRLARRLQEVALPAPLDATVAELVAQFDDLDTEGADPVALAERRVAQLDHAWQVLQRVDGILGLPLDDVDLWPVPPRRPRFKDVPETPEADADENADDQAAAPAGERRRQGRGRKGRLRGRRSGERLTPAAAAPAAPVEAVVEVAPPAPVRRPLVGARWDTAVGDLEVDDELAEAAAAVQLETVLDVLTRAPLAHDLWSPVHGAGRALPAGEVAVGGRVRVRLTVCHPDGTRQATVLLRGAGPLRVAWSRGFSASDLERLQPGHKVVVVGTTEFEDASDVVDAEAPVEELEAEAPADDAAVVVETSPEDETTDPMIRTPKARVRQLVGARLVSVDHGQAWHAHYGLGEHDTDFGELVSLLLPSVEELEEPLGGRVLSRHGLIRLDQAVAAIHPPGDAAAARRRLAFDEALVVQLGLSQARFAETAERGISHTVPHQYIAELGQRQLDLPLDDAQQSAFEAIKRDLKAPSPMLRVLCGDTMGRAADVALHVLLAAAEGRTQILVVASDAPSAQVIHDRYEEVLRTYGIVPLLLSGEPRRADRDALRRGEVHVAFGAPAILDMGLEWRRLGLVVAFEQATYGDVPLKVAAMRSPRPDLLVVAHTPLPAHVLHGAYPGADLSWVTTTTPVCHGTVWRENQREEAYRAVGALVADGSQAVIVYPLRRGGADLLTLREVDGLVATLQAQVFGDARVTVFHGAHTVRERLQAWSDFVEQRAQVLVCTATVEQMPPFPRPVIGLVEHADRIDPQRLLGLRGIVGPKGHLHFVVGNEPDVVGATFVAALASGASDSDAVALHGPGFEVVAACGPVPRPAFRWLDPVSDVALLVAARAEAHTLLLEDGALRQGAGPRVVRLVHAVWPGLMGEMPLPAALVRTAPVGQRKKRRRRRRR